jgi:hypothetical protein
MLLSRNLMLLKIKKSSDFSISQNAALCFFSELNDRLAKKRRSSQGAPFFLQLKKVGFSKNGASIFGITARML